MFRLFEPVPEPPKIEFQIVGMITSPEFQLCRCYTERLYKSFPNEYAKPDIKPMLDVEWNLFITRARREIGGEKLWAHQKPVAVYMNGEFLGHDTDLLKYVSKRYRLTIMKDFEQIGTQRLTDRINKQIELGSSFVYLTIAIDDNVIGSMLFQIYSELVPIISQIFTKRCVRKRWGFDGTSIQRIVRPSWIQCGGWKLKHCNLPCENYIIRHDSRGILSMCHNGKHTDNSTQFFITLDPTPWMDYKYVAFGKLIQGDEVLKTIEKVPTHYEAPLKKIKIVKCGELNFYQTPDKKSIDELEAFLNKKDSETNLHEDIIDPRDAASVMLKRRYERGLYSIATDMQSHLPFLHLPDHLIYKCLKCEEEDECCSVVEVQEEKVEDEHKESSCSENESEEGQDDDNLAKVAKARGFRGTGIPTGP